MRARTPGHLRLLSTLVATAVTATFPGACGGRNATTSTSDGGGGDDGSGSLDGSEGSTSSSGTGDDGASGSDAIADGEGSDSTMSSGSSSGVDSGSSSSSSASGSNSSGACMITTTMFPVDQTKCVPQLQSESTLTGATGMCMMTVEQPCFGDAGVADGAVTDDGGDDASNTPDPCAPCRPFTDAGNVVSGFCSTILTSDNKGFVTSCGQCCIGGRSPRGFRPRPARTRSARAARLAAMAQVEAASVDAFHALHTDLAALGAPRRILSAVRAAAKDEVRHARAVGRAAERFGARVPCARVPLIARRSLEQLAIENAEEGCVREAFGAALAAVQSARAADARVRRMMRVIAREELRHAALAWDIDRWLHARLDADSRARVRGARVAALEKLRSELAAAGQGDSVLGLPAASSSLALLQRMWNPLASGLQPCDVT